MIKNNNVFIEICYNQRQKAGNMVCGDVFLSKKNRAENRTIAVLSDGLGSGIKANVLATMTAAMALNFTATDEPIERSSKIIMNSLPIDSDYKISYATFTIVDINSEGVTKIVEYGNPRFLLLRDGEFLKPKQLSVNVSDDNLIRHKMFMYEFTIKLNDRIILISDGVSQSGLGSLQMPQGWDTSSLQEFILSQVKADDSLSAEGLAERVVIKADSNDQYQSKDDITCSVVYCRKPRRLLLATGPPFYKEKDTMLAELVADYDGKTVVAGGTTAAIVSRVLSRDILEGDGTQTDSLPSNSNIDGVDLVTEGILTLGRVTKLLEEPNVSLDKNNSAIEIYKLLMDSDYIEFVVGTRVNNAHQDPELPVELEIRRNVVKKIVRLLEDKYLKHVDIRYI